MFPDSYFSDLNDILTNVKFPVMTVSSLRVGFDIKPYREVVVLRNYRLFTGSRYIFLRCAAKNTRTDARIFNILMAASFRVGF